MGSETKKKREDKDDFPRKETKMCGLGGGATR